MHPILRDNHKTPDHALCEQFWHGTGLTTLKITHSGSSNFAVKAYGDSSRLLVNEIGKYSGETLLPSGTVLLEVEADGNWTLEKVS
jgi:hypothetical protein